MTPNRYAVNTKVPVGQTRSDIDKLLRVWGVSQISWADDIAGGRAMVRFLWKVDQTSYIARFDLEVDVDDPQLQRCAFRALLLWLKACFVSIEAGIVTAEQLFLPFLEGADGRTFGEVALAQLPTMLEKGGAANLLPSTTQREPCSDDDCIYPLGHKPPHSFEELGV